MEIPASPQTVPRESRDGLWCVLWIVARTCLERQGYFFRDFGFLDGAWWGIPCALTKPSGFFAAGEADFSIAVSASLGTCHRYQDATVRSLLNLRRNYAVLSAMALIDIT
jgi:hypothetical protein